MEEDEDVEDEEKEEDEEESLGRREYLRIHFDSSNWLAVGRLEGVRSKQPSKNSSSSGEISSGSGG